MFFAGKFGKGYIQRRHLLFRKYHFLCFCFVFKFQEEIKKSFCSDHIETIKRKLFSMRNHWQEGAGARAPTSPWKRQVDNPNRERDNGQLWNKRDQTRKSELSQGEGKAIAVVTPSPGRPSQPLSLGSGAPQWGKHSAFSAEGLCVNVFDDGSTQFIISIAYLQTLEKSQRKKLPVISSAKNV